MPKTWWYEIKTIIYGTTIGAKKIGIKNYVGSITWIK